MSHVLCVPVPHPRMSMSEFIFKFFLVVFFLGQTVATFHRGQAPILPCEEGETYRSLHLLGSQSGREAEQQLVAQTEDVLYMTDTSCFQPMHHCNA